MKSWLSCMAALVLAALSATQAAQAAPPRYRLEALDLPPFNSGSTRINNAGDIVGTLDAAGVSAPFLLRDGRLQVLPGLQDVVTRGLALNNRGDVAVGVRNAAGASQAFLYQDGRLRELPLPAGLNNTWVVDLNEAGQVLGSGLDADGVQRSFLFDGRTSRLLDTGAAQVDFRGLNDQGVVVGGQRGASGLGVAVWRDGALSVLRSDDMAFVDLITGIDINNAGQILIRTQIASPPDFPRDSWLYTDGRYERLNIVDGNRNIFFEPWALNERGWVVGGEDLTWDIAERPEALLYMEGGLHRLDSLLRPADAARWDTGGAWDINDAGQIVGYAWDRDSGALHRFLATPVPEPGTWALMAAGLALVAVAVRRRRAAAAA